MKLILLMCFLAKAICYLPQGKDSLLSGIFLRDLVNRINGKEISEGDGVSYLDFTDGLPLDGRSLSSGLEEEQMFPLDYGALGGMNLHPSIRDQEYLQHSSLWGKQFLNEDRDGNQLLQPEGLKFKGLKSKSTLPAYCSPPNPCPIGYTASQGCIETFENSASFSRRYQASQDCMCDTEHMFDCENSNDVDDDNNMNVIDFYRFNRMWKQPAKLSQIFPHKSLIAKKFHQSKVMDNPFLTGEKLPVAAKKGNNVLL